MKKFLKIKYTVYIIILFLSSCFPEDIRIEPYEPGELQTGYVEIGSKYQLQSYYDLKSNSEISKNALSDWDLGFETAEDGFMIILNSSKFMYAGNSGDTTFEAVSSAEGVTMLFDSSSGNPDSTAIGQWYVMNGDSIHSRKDVYIIDRGFNDQEESIGFKKVQFDYKNDSYWIRQADPDNQNETVTQIERDNTRSFVCYSFENGIVNIEPDKDSWTIKISRYTTMLRTNTGEDYPYRVFGVLINPYRVAASLISSNEFLDFTVRDTTDIALTNIWDIIGYNWKDYNGEYVIVPDKFYIIKDRDGIFYKLRFTDFYNNDFETGYPKFEFSAL